MRRQWLDYLHRSTRVDPEVQARSVRAHEEALEKHQTIIRSKLEFATRGTIGASSRRGFASTTLLCILTDPEGFESVANFHGSSER